LLHCSQNVLLIGGRFVGYRPTKAVVWHPDETMLVRSQFRLLLMGFVAVKHLRDGFALIGCERCHIDDRSNDSSSISMAN
jgi:hypothetical protein